MNTALCYNSKNDKAYEKICGNYNSYTYNAPAPIGVKKQAVRWKIEFTIEPIAKTMQHKIIMTSSDKQRRRDGHPFLPARQSPPLPPSTSNSKRRVGRFN